MQANREEFYELIVSIWILNNRSTEMKRVSLLRFCFQFTLRVKSFPLPTIMNRRWIDNEKLSQWDYSIRDIRAIVDLY